MSKLTATWMGTFESLRNYENINPSVITAFIDYAVNGKRTGDFLYAVLTNNLQRSFAEGDLSNLATLWAIATFVYNRMPGDCHGSVEKVAAWKGLRNVLPSIMSAEDVELVIGEWIKDAKKGTALDA